MGLLAVQPITKHLIGNSHHRDWIAEDNTPDEHGWNDRCVRITYCSRTGRPLDLCVWLGNDSSLCGGTVYCYADRHGVFGGGQLDPLYVTDEAGASLVDAIEACYKTGRGMGKLLFELCVRCPALAVSLNALLVAYVPV